MKFTVVSHACLYIEYKNIRLLIDPWIIGSCYWRSWWNYPEVTEDLQSSINPTHIYITHLHWDHYHGPSLRKFQNCNPKILLPKHFTKRMKGDLLKDFNFSNIKELDHGKKYKLEDDFQIASYQFNPIFIDSSLVIEADGITLFNSNDCKTFGFSLRQIINNHPRIDFTFRSHSSASAVPHCIRGMKVDETNRKPSDFADDFTAFGKETKSRYVIPFASSHIYLHELTKKYNKYYSDPSYIKKHFDLKVDSNQKCKIMVSGSSWSKSHGFDIKKHEFSNLESDIANYSIKNKEKFERQVEIKGKQKLNKKAFENYYIEFLKACSLPLKILKLRFGFFINEKKSSTNFLCIIDGVKTSTKIIKVSSEEEIYKNKLAFVIKTPIYVFNDCNTKKMHNAFPASKLLEVIITEKNGLEKLNNYFSLVNFYENDSLPLHKLFSIRNIIIIFRRWRELFDLFYYLFIIKIQKKKIHQLWHSL